MSESQPTMPATIPYSEPVEYTPKGPGFLHPKTMDEAIKICELLAKSSMVPDEYKGKPENVLVALEMGSEVGLGPMQSLQNISVIGGRPSIWGDAMLALVMGSSLCEDIQEFFDDKTETATCIVKRVGMSQPRKVTYSFVDAQKAGLIGGKSYVWKTNPKRMTQMRARSFALRDVFPDVLKGLAKLPLTDERNVKDITEPPKLIPEPEPEPEPEAVDAEFTEDDESEPELDKATAMAMEVIYNAIDNATTKKEMAILSQQIRGIPSYFHPGLVDAWNKRLETLKGDHRQTTKEGAEVLSGQ